MGIETQIVNGTITQTINFPESDIIPYIGIGIAGITAYFLWRQIRKQTKVDSARFTIDYIDKVLKDNKDVIDILYTRIDDNTIKFKSDKSVRILLNGFENTIQFANDGIIQKSHIFNILKITFIMIKNDSEVQRIIKDAQAKNKIAFELLVKFINEKID